MAVSAAAVKVAVTLASDKRTWQIIGGICLLLFFLVFGVLFMIQGSGADLSKQIVLASFDLSDNPQGADEETQKYIDSMRGQLKKIDMDVQEENKKIKGDKLDELKVKSFYYAVFAQREAPDDNQRKEFVRCFIHQRRPLEDFAEMAQAVQKAMGIEDATDGVLFAQDVYTLVTNQTNLPKPNGVHNWLKNLLADDNTPFAGAEFAEPVPNWRQHITSEFGQRDNPTSPEGEAQYHKGMDIAMPQGTEIRATQAGKVVLADNGDGSYGKHLAIHHGGKIVTLYAHCSVLLVKEGDTVQQGQVIARVGSTGNSTGPHLHFEVVEDGQPVNPRNYLERSLPIE